MEKKISDGGFVPGDIVVGRLSGLKYVVLDVKKEQGMLGQFRGAVFKDLYCKCSNGNVGWLCSGEVKKVE